MVAFTTAQRFGGKVGGIIAGLPSTTVPAIFYALSDGLSFNVFLIDISTPFVLVVAFVRAMIASIRS